MIGQFLPYMCLAAILFFVTLCEFIYHAYIKFMVRTIITPTNTDIHLSIGKEYVGKAIEITYLALDELEPRPAAPKTMADFWNTISDATASRLHDNVTTMRDEWTRDI